MIIKVDKPTLRRKDMDAVLQTMADEQIGPGAHASSFVEKFRQTCNLEGSTYALRTAFDALSYAIRSLELTCDTAIAVSALSPAWYASVITSCGCRAFVLDIDPETGNLDFCLVSEAYASNDIGAIILYEPYGNLPSSSPWRSLGIPIIEDITESIGSVYGEDAPGKFGHLLICAFEESSVVSTGGGALVHASDPTYAEHLSSMLEPQRDLIGLPDMNAALGVVQLDHLKRNCALTRAIFDRYRQALMRTSHQLFGIRDIDFQGNGYGFVVVMEAKPDEGRKFALNYEVETEKAFPRTVSSQMLERFDLFPNAIPCMLRGIRFPLYPFLSKQHIIQIEKVISHLP